MDIKEAVLQGYSDRISCAEGAIGLEAAQVCRMDAYDPELLRKVPKEIIERDYGCGNPSKFAKSGDVVLDLGSGSGKICYILAQIVGADGKVIGVDINKDMLSFSRGHLASFAKETGLSNMEFVWGSIDDLATNLEFVEEAVCVRNINSLGDYEDLQKHLSQQRSVDPIIPDNSIDLVVSNCVINLVETERKNNIFKEIFRVLRPGGRIALSDNVSNIEVPEDIKKDPELWVGCYSGVYQEQEFYRTLQRAGFIGLEVENRAEVPEKKIGDVEFQSVTVTGFKPVNCTKDTPQKSVLYRGPWAEVTDDTGQRLKRGNIYDVEGMTADQLCHPIYADHLHFITDQTEIPKSECCQ